MLKKRQWGYQRCQKGDLSTALILRLFTCGSLGLGHARDVFSLEVVLELADLLATLDPALANQLTTLFGQLIQSGPVDRVVVAELNITTHRLHELAGRNMLAQVLVELQLLTSLGVNEGCDQLEEA